MNRKLLIGSLVTIAAILYLVISNIGGTSTYYLTVGELKAKGPSIYGKNVRVAGTVIGESIQWDPDRLVLRFEIADESGRLPVIYYGPRPDMLRDGASAVVEGKYTPEGVFKVNPGGLMLKCPSKYEEKLKESNSYLTTKRRYRI
ncbi:MAG: cytochrome c maturation protein CcmE [Chloroflexi bacterium]|nr:MAG: cytochrome c maturation protein CcmE [Chloroflexota bacterium]HDN80486.1 cytochrome c maturation protein CcmE [Chloroflexota bacterium]